MTDTLPVATEPARNDHGETRRRSRSRGRANRLGALALLLVVLFLVPLPLDAYQQSVATRVVIFALFAMSLDLVYGYAGLVSLGHAAFFGAGGYAVGLLMVKHGITNFWVGGGVAVLCSAVLAAIIGVIALRARGVYFVLVTFALGEMVYSLAQQWNVLQTQGAEAVVGITQPDVSPIYVQWTSLNIYWFTLIIAVVGTAVLAAAAYSRFGDILKGIRENEPRMNALGFNTWLYKWAAFVLGGAVAGLAGVLFSYWSGIIAPTNVDVSQSGLVVLMIIVGGTGRLYGAAIGAALVVLTQYLAEQNAPEHTNLILGCLFVAAVVVLRGGVVARLDALRRAVTRRNARRSMPAVSGEGGRP